MTNYLGILDQILPADIKSQFGGKGVDIAGTHYATKEAVRSQEHIASGDSLLDYPENSTINLTFEKSCKNFSIANRDSNGTGLFVTVIINDVSHRVYPGDSQQIDSGVTGINQVSIVGTVGMDVSWKASI